MPTDEVPLEIRPAAHTSEWLTLTTEHAVALAAAEAQIRTKWRRHFRGDAYGDWRTVYVQGHGDIYGSPDVQSMGIEHVTSGA